MKKIVKLIGIGLISLSLGACSNAKEREQKSSKISDPQEYLLTVLKETDKLTSMEENSVEWSTQIDGDGGKLNVYKSSKYQMKTRMMKKNENTYRIMESEGMLNYNVLKGKKTISLSVGDGGTVVYTSMSDSGSSNTSSNPLIKFVQGDLKKCFSVEGKEVDKNYVVTYKLKDSKGYLEKLHAGNDIYVKYKDKFDNPNVKDCYYEFTMNEKNELVSCKQKVYIDYGEGIVDDTETTFTLSKINEHVFDVDKMEELLTKVEKGELKKGDKIELIN